jgi:Gas vesicle synthesis protein GvpL/GvpF
MADSVVYLYAVTDAAPADGRPDEHALAGVDGAPVRRIVSGDLAAVVSSVDPTRFSEEALRRSLEDLQWLERIARAHNAVVTAVARTTPVAPVRLATVYLDDENVRRLLDERAPEFTAALDRIRGRAEWGVKGFAVRTEGDTSSQATEESKPGTAYLMRRRAERDRAARGLQDAAEAAEAVHKAMSAVAVASRRYQPQDPRLSGRREEMVLNVAYLVDEDGAEALRRLVEREQGHSLRLELTGPWAPYSFATLEEGP